MPTTSVSVPTLDHLPESIDPSEIPPLRLAVYGEPGSGKTTLALSFPRPLIISIDNGLEGGAVFQALDGAEKWMPVDWKDLNALYFWIKKQIETKGYESIIVDSITSLAMLIRHEALLQEASKRDAGQALVELFAVTQPDYNRVATALEMYLLKLVQLSDVYGVHVVLTANVREPDIEHGQTKRSFDLQPAVERVVLQWANIYGELVAEEIDDPADKELPRNERRKIERRVLWTRVQDPRRKNKSRFAALNPGVKDPTFEKIWDLVGSEYETEDTEATTTPTPAPKKEKASDSTQARKGK